MSTPVTILEYAWRTRVILDKGFRVFVVVEDNQLALYPANGSYEFVILTDKDLVALLMFAIDNLQGFGQTLRERMEDEYGSRQ